MKNCLIILAFITLLSACADDVVEPQVTPPKSQDTDFSPFNVTAKTIPYNPGLIPSGCSDWSSLPWPGQAGYMSSYSAIQAWMHCATLKNQGSGLVEVDYFVLMDIRNGDTSVVDILNYRDIERSLSTNEGGLFSRYPKWYESNDFLPMDNSIIRDGILEIKPTSDKISHWWMNGSGKYPRDPSIKYFIICRLRITGDIGVQIAADYYKDQAASWPDLTEAFHSPWLGDTKGEFITVRYPN
jgi:hypothetical protein